MKEENTKPIREKANLEKVAEIATQWIGSTASLIFHTIFFAVAFLLPLVHAISFEKMLLVLTTVVSLEAIYLAIFIQMAVNKNSQDIEIIQEDMEEIQEDVEEIQEDIDEIQEDIDEIQEDVEEMAEEEEPMPSQPKEYTLAAIQNALSQIQQELEWIKRNNETK